jgi:pimeloyl-[acyl-carrier protein] methyl ester esterase
MPDFQTTGGIRLHYEDAGSGRPLVCIHGWGMSGRIWGFNEEPSPPGRLVMPDLRGHGASSAPGSGYSLEDFAADLEELFTELQLDRGVLLGWSLGAQVALQAVPLLRNRLDAVILVSGTPRFTAAEDYPHGLSTNAVRGLGLRLKRDYEAAMTGFFTGMFVKGEAVPEKSLLPEFPPPHAALAALRTLAEADLRPLLPAIDLPVLLIHGDADPVCLSSASQFMAEQLPDALLEIMTGAGHAPFISSRAGFIASVSRFLEGLHAYD